MACKVVVTRLWACAPFHNGSIKHYTFFNKFVQCEPLRIGTGCKFPQKYPCSSLTLPDCFFCFYLWWQKKWSGQTRLPCSCLAFSATSNLFLCLPKRLVRKHGLESISSVHLNVFPVLICSYVCM